MTNQANESNTEITATENIDRLTFGVEIETFGLGHRGCAEAIRKVVGGTVSDGYSNASCTDRWGRTWRCVPDGSISGAYGSEVVTPVLRHSHDMNLLQEVVRSLRAAGARVNSSCGIHVHVGLTSMGRTEKDQVRAVKNLCNIVYKHERHINVAVGCGYARQTIWAAPLPTEYIDGIKKAKTLHQILAHYYDKCGTSPEYRTMDTVNQIVPGGYGQYGHYCNARYSGLNLHNLKYRTGNARTVEFRLFDATLHAGKIRAMVTFCLAMAARAANVSRTSPKRKACDNDNMLREQCRWFLKALGLVGDRYDTVRQFVCDAHFDVNGSRIATRQYRAREDRVRRAA